MPPHPRMHAGLMCNGSYVKLCAHQASPADSVTGEDADALTSSNVTGVVMKSHASGGFNEVRIRHGRGHGGLPTFESAAFFSRESATCHKLLPSGAHPPVMRGVEIHGNMAKECYNECYNQMLQSGCKNHGFLRLLKIGWGGRIRTCEWRHQKPLPYHLATPQQSAAYSRTVAGVKPPRTGMCQSMR